MLLVLINLLLLVLIGRLTPRLAPSGGPWTHLCAGLVLGLAFITATVLGIGVLHVLSYWAALAVVAFALGVLMFLEGRLPDPAPAAPTAPVRSGWTIAAGAALGAALGVWYGRPGWSGTAFCFDDIIYHAAVAAHWYQAGVIEYVPFTYQTYYAYNSELVALWFVLPTGHLAHAGIATLLFAGLLVAATMSIAETHEVPPPVPLALLAALLASHKLMYFARTFNGTDLAMSVYVLAAIAFTVRPPSLRSAAWAGLAGGLAIGTKVSAVPLLGLLGLFWVARALLSWRNGTAPYRALGLPALFAIGLCVLGSYWYIRNLIHTGNPVFPATVGPLVGPLEPEVARRTSLMFWIEKDGDTLEWWLDMIGSRLWWPPHIGYAAVVGYVFAFGAALKRDRRVYALIAVIGITFVVLHAFQPFSATINRPHARLHGMVRYVTFFVLLGLPLLSAPFRSSWAKSWKAFTALALVGFGASVYYATYGMYGTTDALWLLAGGSFGLIALGLVGSVSRVAIPAGLALALLVASARDAEKQAYTSEKRSRFSDMGKRHADAWRALDTLPDGSWVAWLSDMPETHALNLPLMGSRLQYRQIPVDRHGIRIDRPLHERWKEEPQWWWWAFKEKPAKDQPVLENLLRSGAGFLVLSRCHHNRGGPWPRPHSMLVATHLPARLYHDKCVEIWDVEAFRGRALQEPGKRKRKRNKRRKQGADTSSDSPTPPDADEDR
jgi:hypothetical protein